MKSKKNILLVEDSKSIHILVAHSLDSNYNLHISETGLKSLDLVKTQKFDLIILDIVLPDTDGYDLCRQLKNIDETKDVPIIFLTSKDSLEDKLKGFENGAIDYITKPFNILEFRARIKAKLGAGGSTKQNLIQDDNIKVDLDSRRVYLKLDGKLEEIDLTAHEFDILVCFMSHVDFVLSRDQLLEKVWKKNTFVSGRTIDTHISKLRKKLGIFSERIHTSHGAGYRFIPSKKAS